MVFQIHINRIFTIKSKRYAPVPNDGDRVLAGSISLKWMKAESWKIHVRRHFAGVQPVKHSLDTPRAPSRDTAIVARSEETVQTLAFKRFYHIIL